jgi:hypothetical protein
MKYLEIDSATSFQIYLKKRANCIQKTARQMLTGKIVNPAPAVTKIMIIKLGLSSKKFLSNQRSIRRCKFRGSDYFQISLAFEF